MPKSTMAAPITADAQNATPGRAGSWFDDSGDDDSGDDGSVDDGSDGGVEVVAISRPAPD
jgi:hypothetical protein